MGGRLDCRTAALLLLASLSLAALPAQAHHAGVAAAPQGQCDGLERFTFLGADADGTFHAGHVVGHGSGDWAPFQANLTWGGDFVSPCLLTLELDHFEDNGFGASFGFDDARLPSDAFTGCTGAVEGQGHTTGALPDRMWLQLNLTRAGFGSCLVRFDARLAESTEDGTGASYYIGCSLDARASPGSAGVRQRCLEVEGAHGHAHCEGPTGLAAEAQAGPSNRVTWDAFAGAQAYWVYRATSSGSFRFLAEVVTEEHADADMDAATPYRYQVTALLGEADPAETNACGVAEAAAIPFFPAWGAVLALAGGLALASRRQR